jgi:hypothetical protein
MPREQEMVPKDKYTIFDKKERKYRKGIHSKWRGSFGLFDLGAEIGVLAGDSDCRLLSVPFGQGPC